MKEHGVWFTFSNSTCDSGRIVTAGYILLKASNSTHRLRYLQSLRNQLPDSTLFFDILLHRRTPADQSINHLVVQCGEHHVVPLSKILSEHLTSSTTALSLSRLVFVKLSQTEIQECFLKHDAYIKMLRSITLPVALTNLDLIRTEYFESGEVMERTTRAWAASLLSLDGSTSVRRDAVNGGTDKKAYLLGPPSNLHSTHDEALRAYRLRLNPIGQREEARFRDSIPGLPDVIHIDVSAQSNLDFLSKLTPEVIWQHAPSSVTLLSVPVSGHPPHPLSHHLPIPPPPRSTPPRPPKTGNAKTIPATGNTHGIKTDDQTCSTQSTRTPSVFSSARFQELESMMQKQHNELAAVSKNSTSKYTALEMQLQRLSDQQVCSLEHNHQTLTSITELKREVQQLTRMMHRIVSERLSDDPSASSSPPPPIQVDYPDPPVSPTNPSQCNSTVTAASRTPSSTHSRASSSSGSSGTSRRPPKKPRPLHTNMEQLSIQQDSTVPFSHQVPTENPPQLLTSLALANSRISASPTESEDSFNHLEETADEILYPIPPSNANLDMQYTDPSVPDGGENGSPPNPNLTPFPVIVPASAPILAPALAPVSVTVPSRTRSSGPTRRWQFATPEDAHPEVSYGDDAAFKPAANAMRVFFQNIKGLTHSCSGCEGYKYCLNSLSALQVDIAGLTETNTPWLQSPHLQADFRHCMKQQFKLGKVVFGSPDAINDPFAPSDTYQAGGNLTLAAGSFVPMVLGSSRQLIQDPRGLGRWSGITLCGKNGQLLSLITGYRTCKGNIASASLDSTYHREYTALKPSTNPTPDPRKMSIDDLTQTL